MCHRLRNNIIFIFHENFWLMPIYLLDSGMQSCRQAFDLRVSVAYFVHQMAYASLVVRLSRRLPNKINKQTVCVFVSLLAPNSLGCAARLLRNY